MYMDIKDVERREEILFDRKYSDENYRFGGVCHFDELTLKQAKQLIALGYMDPDQSQNCSPTVQEFIDFVESQKKPDDWLFNGYAVSPERFDVRVSIEGVHSISPVGIDRLTDFILTFRFADILDVGQDRRVACWYD